MSPPTATSNRILTTASSSYFLQTSSIHGLIKIQKINPNAAAATSRKCVVTKAPITCSKPVKTLQDSAFVSPSSASGVLQSSAPIPEPPRLHRQFQPESQPTKSSLPLASTTHSVNISEAKSNELFEKIQQIPTEVKSTPDAGSSYATLCKFLEIPMITPGIGAAAPEIQQIQLSTSKVLPACVSIPKIPATRYQQAPIVPNQIRLPPFASFDSIRTSPKFLRISNFKMSTPAVPSMIMESKPKALTAFATKTVPLEASTSKASTSSSSVLPASKILASNVSSIQASTSKSAMSSAFRTSASNASIIPKPKIPAQNASTIPAGSTCKSVTVPAPAMQSSISNSSKAPIRAQIQAPNVTTVRASTSKLTIAPVSRLQPSNAPKPQASTSQNQKSDEAKILASYFKPKKVSVSRTFSSVATTNAFPLLRGSLASQAPTPQIIDEKRKKMIYDRKIRPRLKNPKPKYIHGEDERNGKTMYLVQWEANNFTNEECAILREKLNEPDWPQTWKVHQFKELTPGGNFEVYWENTYENFKDIKGTPAFKNYQKAKKEKDSSSGNKSSKKMRTE